jgi:drug/metabolite transporter (DMT)-like permease
MSYSSSDAGTEDSFLGGPKISHIEDLEVELDDMSTDSTSRSRTDHIIWEKLDSRHSSSKQDFCRNMWLQNKGVVLVLFSMFFAASMDMAVRILEIPSDGGEPAISTPQILFMRHILTTGAILIYGYASTNKILDFPWGDRKVIGLLIARGVAGFVAVFGIYFSLPYLTLTEATVLTFIAPIITCYANAMLLEGESFNSLQQLASGISVAGVLVIAFVANAEGNDNKLARSPQPSSASNLHHDALNNQEEESQNLPASSSGLRRIAIFVALLGVFGQAGGMIVTRMIGPRAHPLIILGYSSLASILFCGVALLGMHVKIQMILSVKQWLLLLLATLCGFMFQLLLTKGLQYGAACSEDKVQGCEYGELDQARLHRIDRGSVSGNDIVTTGLELDGNEKSQEQKVGVNRAVSMMYTQAIFALMYDWVIWTRLPLPWSWFGNFLIIIGAVLVAVTKS